LPPDSTGNLMEEQSYINGNMEVLEDKQGIMHNLEIPNTLYAPHAPCTLLSPQHWSQQNQYKGGTSCLIQTQPNDTHMGRKKYSKNVMLNKENNCRSIKSWKQENKYRKFLQAMNSSVKSSTTDTHIIKPIKIKDGDNIKPITPYNFKTTVITDWKQKEVDENSDTKRHMLKSHIRLNHLPFRQVKAKGGTRENTKRNVQSRYPI